MPFVRHSCVSIELYSYGMHEHQTLLCDCGTFVGDSSIKFQLKIAASQLYVNRAFQFFYLIKTVSLKRKQRREQRVYSQAFLIEDGIHKSLHFSASTPGLGFVVTRKTLPKRCYQKPPDRKSTLKRERRTG